MNLQSNIVAPPILFIIFNRPAETARVFEKIRKAQPTKLYIASDGARTDKCGEELLVNEARRIALSVDWPCQVKTLFRDRNYGCKYAVSSAISWFFSDEPEGIILEDDCLPHQDFFSYCAELLERYRDDTRIGVVCGTNTVNLYKKTNIEDTYYFSKNISVWGWASWRRVWEDYDVNMSTLEMAKERKIFQRLFSEKTSRYLTKLFDSVAEGKINTWDYQLSYSLFCNGRLNIIPSVNMINNIGFNNDATHTKAKYALESNNVAMGIVGPMRHPPFIVQDKFLDDYMNEIYTSRYRRWVHTLVQKIKL